LKDFPFAQDLFGVEILAAVIEAFVQVTKCDWKLRELPAKSHKNEGENCEFEKNEEKPKTNTRKSKVTPRGYWGGTLRLNPQRGDFGPESQTTMPRHKVNAINTRRRHIAGIMYYV